MKLKLTVDGKVYEVDVEVSEPEPPRPAYVPPSGQAFSSPPAAVSSSPGLASAKTTPSAADRPVDERKVCRSPIAGVVVRVAAQPGQAIQPNDVLLVLEAMKMETVITAPVAGKVVKVNVEAGDGVQRGQVLVEFE